MSDDYKYIRTLRVSPLAYPERVHKSWSSFFKLRPLS
jgi:hypothetical protein